MKKELSKQVMKKCNQEMQYIHTKSERERESYGDGDVCIVHKCKTQAYNEQKENVKNEIRQH